MYNTLLTYESLILNYKHKDFEMITIDQPKSHSFLLTCSPAPLSTISPPSLSSLVLEGLLLWSCSYVGCANCLHTPNLPPLFPKISVASVNSVATKSLSILPAPDFVQPVPNGSARFRDRRRSVLKKLALRRTPAKSTNRLNTCVPLHLAKNLS